MPLTFPFSQLRKAPPRLLLSSVRWRHLPRGPRDAFLLCFLWESWRFLTERPGSQISKRHLQTPTKAAWPQSPCSFPVLHCASSAAISLILLPAPVWGGRAEPRASPLPIWPSEDHELQSNRFDLSSYSPSFLGGQGCMCGCVHVCTVSSVPNACLQVRLYFASPKNPARVKLVIPRTIFTKQKSWPFT